MKQHFGLSLLMLLTLLTVLPAAAQPGPDHEPLRSPTWDIIGELRYIERESGEYIPLYSSSLQRLEGKEVQLQGYMVPYERGIEHSRFALSVLPLYQCQFCGSDGIPPIVEVEASKPINFTYKPITMKGRIRLNPDDTEKLEIILTGAVETERTMPG